jgi:hypothetical protein
VDGAVVDVRVERSGVAAFVGDGFEPVRGLVASHVQFLDFLGHVGAHGWIKK